MKNFAVILYLIFVYAVVMLIGYQLGINSDILAGMAFLAFAAMAVWAIAMCLDTIKKIKINLHFHKSRLS